MERLPAKHTNYTLPFLKISRLSAADARSGIRSTDYTYKALVKNRCTRKKIRNPQCTKRSPLFLLKPRSRDGGVQTTKHVELSLSNVLLGGFIVCPAPASFLETEIKVIEYSLLAQPLFGYFDVIFSWGS